MVHIMERRSERTDHMAKHPMDHILNQGHPNSPAPNQATSPPPCDAMQARQSRANGRERVLESSKG